MLLSKLINKNKVARSLIFQNILFVREDEIGDLCYSLHVFKSIRKQFPNAKTTILCKSFAVPLLKNDPNIDMATSDWSELTNNYDLIVDLRGSWKSIGYAMKHRPALRLDRGTARYRNKLKGSHPHDVFTNLQVIEPLLDEQNKITEPELYFSDEDSKKAISFLAEKNITSFAVLHTGARRELRKWPLKNFAALAIFLKDNFHFDIIFCGDSSDLHDIQEARQMIPFDTFSIAGNFSLSEFSALVSKANLYVGNESGPLQIACVAGAPSLGLFGPGEPFVFYPYGKKTAFLHHVLECNPCDQIHCVHPDNPCIGRITMEEVRVKVEEVLRK